MVFIINYDAIFTLYNSDIGEIELVTFLEYVVKESIYLLIRYFKAYYVLFGLEDIICLYFKSLFICFISSSEDRMVRVTPYHF